MSFCLLSITDLSSFMFGMPYMRRPPTRSSRSNTVMLWPRWFNSSAQARPAGPEPTIATLLPERILGILGWIVPFAQAVSMM